jgi:Xaa-Pro aminopeptidase
MFDKEVYVKRRNKLAQEVGRGVIVLMGNEESSMNYRDNCYPFRQDSTFLYYVGINKPGLVLLMNIDEGMETLYGHNASLDDIIWTGALPSIIELASLSGINHAKKISSVGPDIESLQNSGQRIHILPPYRPENVMKLMSWLNAPLAKLPLLVSEPLIKAIVKQREVKEQVEIEEIEKAVNISGDMHLAAMRYTRPGMKEFEVLAKVEEAALAANARTSYPVILTINGQILHNHYHGNTIRDGNMILCDAGAENSMCYAGDLTRTFPAGKSFTSEQKEIYQAVLDSFQHAVSLLKPGIEFREVHRQAAVKLLEGLKQIGLVTGDPEEAVQHDVHTLFFQCGLGHMMGLDVHDMEDLGEEYVGYTDTIKRNTSFGWKSLRLAKELQSGFVLTVEPGVYIIPELIARWKAENKLASFVNYSKLETMLSFGGIRIEDNFLITDNGSHKFGKDLPTTINEVESFRDANF